jgi:hypothetical protein
LLALVGRCRFQSLENKSGWRWFHRVCVKNVSGLATIDQSRPLKKVLIVGQEPPFNLAQRRSINFKPVCDLFLA